MTISKYRQTNIKRELEKNYINFTPSKIRIGSEVAAFFINREFSKVILHYDILKKNLIIEGMNAEKIKSYEYDIVDGKHIASVKVSRQNGGYVYNFFIMSTIHTGLLDLNRRHLKFKAKPISKDKVMIENLPMLEHMKIISNGCIIDAKNYKIINYAPSTYETSVLVRRKNGEMSMTDKLIQQAKQKRSLNKQYTTIKLNEEDKQNKNYLEDIPNKEIDNVWGFEKPAGKLPSTKDRIEADKRNKKTILGE